MFQVNGVPVAALEKVIEPGVQAMKYLPVFWFGVAWGGLTTSTWTEDASAESCLTALALGVLFAALSLAKRLGGPMTAPTANPDASSA